MKQNQKRFGFWGYLKSLSFRDMEKKTNYFKWISIASDVERKYPYKYLLINIV